MSRTEKKIEAQRKRNGIIDELQAIVAHELRNGQSVIGAFRRVGSFIADQCRRHPREKTQYERAFVEYKGRCKV